MDKLKQKAEQLAQVRKSIAEYEAQMDEILIPLKIEKDKIQQELLDEFHTVGLKSIKADSGESYAIKKSRSLQVTDTLRALDWATKNHAVNIDKRLVTQKLKDSTEIPGGFEFEEKEFISITKPKAQ